jgi:hypothetical protein
MTALCTGLALVQQKPCKMVEWSNQKETRSKGKGKESKMNKEQRNEHTHTSES